MFMNQKIRTMELTVQLPSAISAILQVSQVLKWSWLSKDEQRNRSSLWWTDPLRCAVLNGFMFFGRTLQMLCNHLRTQCLVCLRQTSRQSQECPRWMLWWVSGQSACLIWHVKHAGVAVWLNMLNTHIFIPCLGKEAEINNVLAF